MNSWAAEEDTLVMYMLRHNAALLVFGVIVGGCAIEPESEPGPECIATSETFQQHNPIYDGSNKPHFSGDVIASPAETLRQYIDLPDMYVLSSVSAIVDPGDDVAVVDTTNLAPPTAALWKSSVSNGQDMAMLATAKDSIVPTDRYVARHSISVVVHDEKFDRHGFYYWIDYTHESGSSATQGLFLGTEAVATASGQADCGAAK